MKGKGLEGDCVAYGNTNPDDEFFVEEDDTCPGCGTKKYDGVPGNLETDVFTIPTKLAAENSCISGGYKEVGNTKGIAGSISTGAVYLAFNTTATSLDSEDAEETFVPISQVTGELFNPIEEGPSDPNGSFGYTAPAVGDSGKKCSSK